MEETEGVKRKNRLAVFEHVVEEEKKIKRIKKDDSESESELVIDDEKYIGTKKKKPLTKLSEEPLKLLCKWNYCSAIFHTWESFNAHLMDHAAGNLRSFKCLWLNCSHESQMIPLLMQHMSYHGYIAKLQNIGENIVDRNGLPECTQIEVCEIPLFPNGYTCNWENCSFNFCTVYEFFTHMVIHIKSSSTVTKEDTGEMIYCRWKGCNNKFSIQARLAEHLRTHTKEKIMGCPTCFTLFSNKTKFCDHRNRQVSTELQNYKCSQCLKLFPTERLLRDHMRSHINHYKCTMCDMTCPKPSILAKHIRFKHVKEKPYKCSECDKSFVAKHNLSVHMGTHNDDNPLACDHCDFSCRSTKGLENHYIKKHDTSVLMLIYECHCCKKKFKRGDYLTKHLTKLHNYHWPSGHSRFRYRKDEDGIYRLQTVRYESLEVTQEMIRSEAMPANNAIPGVSYNLKYDNDGKSGYVLSISETGEQSFNIRREEKNDREGLLITINDVDEQGNILNSHVVESSIGKVVSITDNNTLSVNECITVGIEVKSHSSMAFNECSSSGNEVRTHSTIGNVVSITDSARVTVNAGFPAESEVKTHPSIKKVLPIVDNADAVVESSQLVVNGCSAAGSEAKNASSIENAVSIAEDSHFIVNESSSAGSDVHTHTSIEKVLSVVDNAKSATVNKCLSAGQKVRTRSSIRKITSESEVKKESSHSNDNKRPAAEKEVLTHSNIKKGLTTLNSAKSTTVNQCLPERREVKTRSRIRKDRYLEENSKLLVNECLSSGSKVKSSINNVVSTAEGSHLTANEMTLAGGEDNTQSSIKKKSTIAELVQLTVNECLSSGSEIKTVSSIDNVVSIGKSFHLTNSRESVAGSEILTHSSIHKLLSILHGARCLPEKSDLRTRSRIRKEGSENWQLADNECFSSESDDKPQSSIDNVVSIAEGSHLTASENSQLAINEFLSAGNHNAIKKEVPISGSSQLAIMSSGSEVKTSSCIGKAVTIADSSEFTIKQSLFIGIEEEIIEGDVKKANISDCEAEKNESSSKKRLRCRKVILRMK